jgi:hypothetical protein
MEIILIALFVAFFCVGTKPTVEQQKAFSRKADEAFEPKEYATYPYAPRYRGTLLWGTTPYLCMVAW